MIKNINIGTAPNAGDGIPLRDAFGIINDNFTELEENKLEKNPENDKQYVRLNDQWQELNIDSNDFVLTYNGTTIIRKDADKDMTLKGHMGFDASVNGNAEEPTGAGGMYSFAAGNSTQAIGDMSSALGGYTKALSTFSFACGQSTTAEGFNSFAAGNQTIAKGFGSFVSGDSCIAEGDYSYAFGVNNKAKGISSFAGGKNSTTNGYNSVTLGEGLIANAGGELVLGKFNQPHSTIEKRYINGSPIFSIGNGFSTDKKTTYQIFNNGKTIQVDTANYDKDLTSTFTDLSLVHKGYVTVQINTLDTKLSNLITKNTNDLVVTNTNVSNLNTKIDDNYYTIDQVNARIPAEWFGTQAEYDAIANKIPTTKYFIED